MELPNQCGKWWRLMGLNLFNAQVSGGIVCHVATVFLQATLASGVGLRGGFGGQKIAQHYGFSLSHMFHKATEVASMTTL